MDILGAVALEEGLGDLGPPRVVVADEQHVWRSPAGRGFASLVSFIATTVLH